PAASVPAIEVAQPKGTPEATHKVDEPSARSDPQRPAPAIKLSPPDDAGDAEPRATKPNPAKLRAALRRELGSVGRAVEVCAARHGGNLVAELAVRVQVGAGGIAERVMLLE